MQTYALMLEVVMAIDISVRSNLRAVQRSLTAFSQQQMPFAAAKALTALANRVDDVETKQLSRVFDRPTPFTLNAIGVRAARKSNLHAVVYVKDKAAGYLAPYEFGGVQKVNGRAMLTPKGSPTNQYGNLPRNLIARLKGRADIFIGPVKTKSGEVINGVWQRPFIRANQNIRGKSKVGKGANTGGALKLLVRFTDPKAVTKHLGYRARAKLCIDTNFNAEFSTAMAQAMASARR
jgi:hypothetical protein